MRPATAGRPRHLGVLLALGALVLLLVGGVGGLLLAPGSGSSTAAPSAGTPSAVDIGFSQDMLVHHAQGVAMAIQAQKATTDQEVRSLAFDIETDQQAEVGEMNGFLDLWGQPRSTVGSYMSWMGGEGAADMAGMAMTTNGTTAGTMAGAMAGTMGTGSTGPGGGSTTAASGNDGAVMPGMATATELARLRSLKGQASDVFFLQLMVRHHEGGAAMMQYAAAHAAVAAVRTFAQTMVNQQAKEIVEMTDMLKSRGAAPLPFALAAPTG